jgi:hypothetical protein
MVDTTPAGLFSEKNWYDCVATVRPSTLTSSFSGSTRLPCSRTTSPLTSTRACSISSSQARRDP